MSAANTLAFPETAEAVARRAANQTATLSTEKDLSAAMKSYSSMTGGTFPEHVNLDLRNGHIGQDRFVNTIRRAEKLGISHEKWETLLTIPNDGYVNPYVHFEVTVAMIEGARKKVRPVRSLETATAG
jgi:hypothetical protein